MKYFFFINIGSKERGGRDTKNREGAKHFGPLMEKCLVAYLVLL